MASMTRKKPKRWSRAVTEGGRALVLEPGLFTWDDSRRIAASLKRSAEASKARRTTAFASAMSMLNLFINRAGRNLPARRRKVLERAKDELRKAYGRPPATKR